MISFKPLLKYYQNSALYFGGSLIQLVVSLLTFPIYSTYLSAVEFGIIGYFTSIIQFFTPIFILSTTNIYLLKFYKQSDLENKKLLFNIIFFLSIINVFSLFICYLGLYLFFSYSNVSFPFYPYSAIILLTIFFEVFKTFALLNFRIRKQAKHFFFLSSIGPILNAIVSILFVKYLSYGAAGRLGGILVSKVIVAIICIFLLRQFMTCKPDFKLFKSTITLAFPLIIAAYAYIPIMALDRILLERIGNPSELGLYSIGNQVAGFLAVASTAIYQAFEPDIYKNVIANLKTQLLKIVSFFVGTNLSVLFLFLLCSRFIFKILTNGNYTEAFAYGNLIAIGHFILSLLQIISAILLALEKIKSSTIITYVGGISSLVIYFFYIHEWGFKGAAWGRITVPTIMMLSGVILLIRTYSKLNSK